MRAKYPHYKFIRVDAYKYWKSDVALHRLNSDIEPRPHRHHLLQVPPLLVLPHPPAVLVYPLSETVLWALLVGTPISRSFWVSVRYSEAEFVLNGCISNCFKKVVKGEEVIPFNRKLTKFMERSHFIR